MEPTVKANILQQVSVVELPSPEGMTFEGRSGSFHIDRRNLLYTSQHAWKATTWYTLYAPKDYTSYYGGFQEGPAILGNLNPMYPSITPYIRI